MRAVNPLLLVLAGTLLVASGCQKQTYSREAGQPVVFSVGTEPGADDSLGEGSEGVEEEALTRVAYRGNAEDYNTSDNNTQPIDWVSGDKIRIFSQECTRPYGGQNWADYTVTLKETTTTGSKGTLSNVQPNGLVWGGDGTYHFWGIYPSPETDSDDAGFSDGKLKWNIPQSQDASTRIPMVALVTTISKSGGSTPINLTFIPAFTSFEFLLEGNGNETLDYIELTSSVSIYGTGSITLSNNRWNWTNWSFVGGGAAHRTVRYTFPEGTTLSSAPTRCRVYTYRRQGYNMGDIQLTIARTYGGKQYKHRLDLKKANGDWLTFSGSGQKHLIKGLLLPNLTQLTVFDAATGQWETVVHDGTVVNY